MIEDDELYINPATADTSAFSEEEQALHDLLGPLWSRVRAWMLWEQRIETGLLVHGLARHLPGVAPAIHTVAQHLLEGDPWGACCGLPPLRSPAAEPPEPAA